MNSLRRFFGVALVAATLLCAPGRALAQSPYALSDLGSGSGINLEAVDHFLDKNFYFARVYPPRIDSPEQLAGIERELKTVISALESALEQDPGDPELLWRLGFAHTMAYNLDWPDSKGKLENYFTLLFEKDPENKFGHLFYGAHLAQAGKDDAQKSLYHLEKAYAYGFDVALTMMGTAYMQLGDTAKALECFKKMREKTPDDPQINMLIEGLEKSEEYEVRGVFVNKDGSRREKVMQVPGEPR